MCEPVVRRRRWEPVVQWLVQELLNWSLTCRSEDSEDTLTCSTAWKQTTRILEHSSKWTMDLVIVYELFESTIHVSSFFKSYFPSEPSYVLSRLNWGGLAHIPTCTLGSTCTKRFNTFRASGQLCSMLSSANTHLTEIMECVTLSCLGGLVCLLDLNGSIASVLTSGSTCALVRNHHRQTIRTNLKRTGDASLTSPAHFQSPFFQRTNCDQTPWPYSLLGSLAWGKARASRCWHTLTLVFS